MKWYFAINEHGTMSPLGLHAKLAVRTAKKMTNLIPHLLYFGRRNDFTAWMEGQGVTVLDVRPSYADDICRAVSDGWYAPGFMGHWLRTEVCNVETDDQIVLYTDIDVVFLRPLAIEHVTPRFFACAPEFREDDWSYFNSGTMVMNIPALRADYPALKEFIRKKFATRASGIFNDQNVYNEFYVKRWSPLEPIYNWKPYWRPNDNVAILHFHGPKIHDIKSIIDGTWDWQGTYGRQVGDIFVTHADFYLHHLKILLPLMDAGDELRGMVEEILAEAPNTVCRLLASREPGSNPEAARPGATPAEHDDRVLTTITCPHCGVKVRLTDTFQFESHIDTDFHWRLHSADHALFSASCRDRRAASNGEAVPAHCKFLGSNILAWMFSSGTTTS
jgi:hypothetical protein